ncbi:unnamed protein product, partial [Musa textilis]
AAHIWAAGVRRRRRQREEGFWQKLHFCPWVRVLPNYSFALLYFINTFSILTVLPYINIKKKNYSLILSIYLQFCPYKIENF